MAPRRRQAAHVGSEVCHGDLLTDGCYQLLPQHGLNVGPGEGPGIGILGDDSSGGFSKEGNPNGWFTSING